MRTMLFQYFVLRNSVGCLETSCAGVTKNVAVVFADLL